MNEAGRENGQNRQDQESDANVPQNRERNNVMFAVLGAVVTMFHKSPHQIKERKEKDPDQVDDVPENSDAFHGSEIVRFEIAAKMTVQNPTDQGHPDQNVSSVQAGHHKVEAEVHRQIRVHRFRVVEEVARQQPVMNLVHVLEVFHDHEDAAADDRRDQTHRRLRIHSSLNVMDRQSHRPRTRDQNDSVESAHSPVEVARSFREHFGIDRVIDEVSDEKSAEHQNLRHHEEPDTLFRGYELMHGIPEVVREVVLMVYCINGTHRAPL